MDPQQLTPEQQKEMEEKLKNMSPEELMEFQKQQCIFCQIISGKIPAKKIYEDDKVLAILDINPAAKGHILLLPKEHYAIMPQIPEKEVGEMFIVAKKMSKLLLKAIKVSGTNIFIANGLVAGQKAQHFMIHIIPRKEDDGILEVEEKLTDQEMRTKVKSLIENKFNELMGVKKEVLQVESSDEEVKEVEELEEPEEIKETKKPAKKVKKKAVKKKGKRENKEKVEEEKPEKESDDKDDDDDDDGGNASLDDIANLFK
ncbi:HIT domain-containing protein [Candidatus Woesearchaeota archaeon]|nr:HIT domain-containing protein [Candidatus Woesearchaeota archaeon]MBT5342482.1 HIT domain-containing protein [Candidatus Woesearchaeota archaeon]